MSQTHKVITITTNGPIDQLNKVFVNMKTCIFETSHRRPPVNFPSIWVASVQR